MSFHKFCYGCRTWHAPGQHLSEPAPLPPQWQLDNAPIERLTARFMAMRNLLVDAMRELPRESALRERIQHTLFAQHMEAVATDPYDITGNPSTWQDAVKEPVQYAPDATPEFDDGTDGER